MKTLFQNEEFCRDAFGDGLRGGFREDVVARMAQTRKRVRFVESARVVCVLAAAVLTLVFAVKKPARPLEVVSVREAPSWKVRTVRFDGIVRTQPLSEVMIVRSDESNVAIVRSAPGMYDLISDEQMFAMLRGWSVALVRVNGVADLEILGP
jgi:hypothetical protein